MKGMKQRRMDNQTRKGNKTPCARPIIDRQQVNVLYALFVWVKNLIATFIFWEFNCEFDNLS